MTLQTLLGKLSLENPAMGQRQSWEMEVMKHKTVSLVKAGDDQLSLEKAGLLHIFLSHFNLHVLHFNELP